MTNNIVDFPALVNKNIDLDPKIILEGIREEITEGDKVFVIKWDREDDLSCYGSSGDLAEIAWFLQMALRDIYNGDYGE